MGTGFPGFSSNYGVQQRYQAEFRQGQPLQATLDQGFNNLQGFSPNAGMGVQGGFGMQLGGFASSFQGLNIQPFNQASMARGGVGMGSNIAAFGSIQSPGLQMAYQNRYSTGGVHGQGNFSTFRGGISAQLQAPQQQFQLPAWMNPASVMAYHPAFKTNQMMSMVRDTNQNLSSYVMDSQRNLAQQVAQLQAGGASPQQIATHISAARTAMEGELTQKRMNAATEMVALITTMNQASHNAASSIISKISA